MLRLDVLNKEFRFLIIFLYSQSKRRCFCETLFRTLNAEFVFLTDTIQAKIHPKLGSDEFCLSS